MAGSGARIVLASRGSLGDLHPMLALALRLRSAGHHPVIAAEAAYRPKIEAEGLEFSAVRPDFVDLERELGMSGPEIMGRLVARDDFLFRKVLFLGLRESVEDGLRAIGGADLLVATGLAYGARFAAERRGLPFVAATLQPAAFFSAVDPPLGPHPLANRLLSALPVGARAGLTGQVKAVINRWAEPAHALRRELGLPAMRDVVFAGQFAGARRTLGLYSPLLGPVQPDYPPATTLTGFCVYDSEAGGDRELSPELARFLAAGDPPVVFSLGSTAVVVGDAFYRESLAAARSLGRRAVILVGADAVDRWASEAGSEVFVAGYEPHSALFSRAAVVIHHGGAGSTGQALRAGRPQLIAPFMTDQPDNGARMVRLGMARMLPHKRYTAARAATHLRALLDDGTYVEAARRSAAVIAGEDGPGSAVQAIEAVLAETSRRSG